MKLTFLRNVAIVGALVVASSLLALADSTLYMFANSAPGAGNTSTPALINLTFGNGHTATLSTGAGFQYFSPSDGWTCDGVYCNVNQGWWTLEPLGHGQVDTPGLPNSNYLAGAFAGATYRDFFTFDTSTLNRDDVASGILSGQFVVTFYDTSPSGNVLFLLSQTTLSPDAINATDNRPADMSGLFADLGNGVANPSMVLGSGNINLPGSGSLTVNLNGTALSQIACSYSGSCSGQSQYSDHLFTVGGSLQAVTRTPEPASFLLLATGIAGVLLRRRH